MVNNTDSFVVAWRCWYNVSGTTVEYNSIQHDLNTIPDDGFQAMRLWYQNGNGRYLSGNDHYFFANQGDGVIFGQSNDSYQSILDRYPGVVIKLGKHVPDGVMHQIDQMMMEYLFV
jgi:hypothetical protein